MSKTRLGWHSLAAEHFRMMTAARNFIAAHHLGYVEPIARNVMAFEDAADIDHAPQRRARTLPALVARLADHDAMLAHAPRTERALNRPMEFGQRAVGAHGNKAPGQRLPSYAGNAQIVHALIAAPLL